ncbi:hypothetical protein AB0A70_34865 [Streptomyces morookaense]|uniref:hypothetical protein n=1 Tax=Streptomyces morookaense TaxID=1970 RepID=UPI0033C005B9
MAADTAYQTLADIGLKSRGTLVVDGAAGGVGTVTVQLARHLGATVIGTASEHNHEYLRSEAVALSIMRTVLLERDPWSGDLGRVGA